jgi:catechol 2,3-dioxygenase-like lactoylglutathione lyase family enzyme
MAMLEPRQRPPGAPPPVWLEGLTLHVRDVERSREFYSTLPGFELQQHRPGQFALFRVGDSLLGLIGFGAPGFHVEVATSDLDQLYERLRDRGVPVKSPPGQRPWGERTLTVVDPDGNQLEFQ